ncbi:hypothetical protein IE81DRAFT_79638 [Ceraceosorus guamensis]|uniref:Copper transport protein n=1 Tax=Ceraceosorus guamensis TaxID=1522189 RepID=A0A316WAF1_9BASI|nr:hypothetical protein IE81DRAFT_79638 [Ceraceosorus guamensis]PWN45998.1 hypothetical protein IE81DRAFT_79638 [Ceraceosorus guamensis]
MIVVLIESVRRWGREWDRYIIRTAMARRRTLQQERLGARSFNAATVPAARHDQPVASCCADDVAETQSGGHHGAPSGAQSSAEASPMQKDALALEEEGGAPIVLTHSGNAAVAGAARDRLHHEKPPAGAAYLAKLERAFFGLPKGSAGERALRSNCPSCLRPTVLQQFIRSLVYAVQFTGAYIVMLIAMSFNGYILISIVLGGLVGHFFSTWDTLCFELEEQEDPYLLTTGGGAGATGLGSNAVAPATLQHDAGEKTTQSRGQGHDTYGQHSGACCG